MKTVALLSTIILTCYLAMPALAEPPKHRPFRHALRIIVGAPIFLVVIPAAVVTVAAPIAFTSGAIAYYKLCIK